MKDDLSHSVLPAISFFLSFPCCISCFCKYVKFRAREWGLVFLRDNLIPVHRFCSRLGWVTTLSHKLQINLTYLTVSKLFCKVNEILIWNGTSSVISFHTTAKSKNWNDENWVFLLRLGLSVFLVEDKCFSGNKRCTIFNLFTSTVTLSLLVNILN